MYSRCIHNIIICIKLTIILAVVTVTTPTNMTLSLSFSLPCFKFLNLSLIHTLTLSLPSFSSLSLPPLSSSLTFYLSLFPLPSNPPSPPLHSPLMLHVHTCDISAESFRQENIVAIDSTTSRGGWSMAFWIFLMQNMMQPFLWMYSITSPDRLYLKCMRSALWDETHTYKFACHKQE